MGNSLPAVDLGRDQKAISVAAGFFHTCAMLYTGVVKCWGEFFSSPFFFRVWIFAFFPRAFFSGVGASMHACLHTMYKPFGFHRAALNYYCFCCASAGRPWASWCVVCLVQVNKTRTSSTGVMLWCSGPHLFRRQRACHLSKHATNDAITSVLPLLHTPISCLHLLVHASTRSTFLCCYPQLERYKQYPPSTPKHPPPAFPHGHLARA